MVARLDAVDHLPSTVDCVSLTDVRVLGFDLGQRRIGIAVSDPSATLARPFKTIERGRSDETAVTALVTLIKTLDDEEPVGCLVIGLPTGLDGSSHDQTARVKK